MIHHAAHSRNPLQYRKEEKQPMNCFAKRKMLALLLAFILLLLAVPTALAEETATATVYFTLSNDGVPVVGNDANGTKLSRVKVTVPYFDLAEYGLQQYYRYETDGFGGYINNVLVKKPTVLHLYIYMLERYYEGLPVSQCGKGKLDMSLSKKAYDLNGRAVRNAPMRALSTSGAATSFYMTNFWGHDENLMYFVNHQYPLMAPGWGATADYILLEDGMDIDVAMFSNWNFYQSGGFMYFAQDDYQVVAGEEQSIAVWKTSTGNSVQGQYAIGIPADGMLISLWNEDMSECIEEEIGCTGEEGVEGEITYTFETPGTYILLAEDPNKGTSNSANAPATAFVHVTDASVPMTDISFESSRYSIEYGDTWQLMPIIAPSNATNVTYSWSSSNPAAVSVSSIGILKGVGEGVAMITCTATDGKNMLTASCEVEVGAVINATGINLIQDTITIAEGGTLQLEYEITPSSANDKSVLWRTSECPEFDRTYTAEEHTTAIVDHQGKLIAKQAGEITVTVRSNDGGFTDTCTVKVVANVKGDITGDGNLNMLDVARLAAAVKGKVSIADSMDVTGDGNVNMLDVAKLAAAVKGKTTLS